MFFFGLDYLGATAAACLLTEDHKVVGVNVSADKNAPIIVGLSPVSEPGLEELLAAGREDGWLSADTYVGGQPEDADMAMICVGGPPLMGSGLDLIQVGAVSEVLSVALKTRDPVHDPLIVTCRSIMYPGAMEEVV